MKRFLLFTLIITFISIQFGCKKDDDNNNVSPEKYTDTRDGQVYATSTISNQTWFTENLNYETPGSTRNYQAIQSWWYDNDPENGKIYGRLYTWEAALKACPSGWHLPSQQEWKSLLINLGVSQSELINEGWVGTDQGKQLKATSGWISGNGTNSSSFNALPGGSISNGPLNNGEFLGLGEDGYWWTSSQHSVEYAFEFDIGAYDDRVYYGHWPKYHGRSVRCVKD